MEIAPVDSLVLSNLVVNPSGDVVVIEWDGRIKAEVAVRRVRLREPGEEEFGRTGDSVGWNLVPEERLLG